MHVHFLDPYRPRPSLIHALDARLKFILALAFILTNALVPVGAWPVYVLLLALTLTVVVLSELGVVYVLKRSALAAPFALAALPLVFTTPGGVLAHLPGGLVLSVAGLERFLSIAFKSWLSVQIAIVLASSTTFPDLLVAMRAVGVPRLLVAIFGLMWRYLFVLVDEALRLLRARAARSGHSHLPDLRPGGSLIWRARVAGGMAGSLLLRAFERSDRIYMAMLSRGYDGEARAAPLSPLRLLDWAILLACMALLMILLVMAYFL